MKRQFNLTKISCLSLTVAIVLGGCFNSSSQYTPVVAVNPEIATPLLSSLASNTPIKADYGRNAWIYHDASQNAGVIEKMGGSRWIECTTNGSYFYFSEYSRNIDYVILYDELRNLYLRLSDDQLELSSNSGSTWSRLVNGAWTEVREAWYYQSQGVFGTFARVTGDTWQETNNKGIRSRFVERGRTNDYIELYDETRQLAVRLYSDRAEAMAQGATSWGLLNNGSWGSLREVWDYTGANSSYGYFARIAGNLWKERSSNNSVYTFTELGRNKDYIELRDDTRNINVRLAAENSTIKIASAAYANFVAGTWGYTRNSWEYLSNGKVASFEKRAGRSWQEISPNGVKYNFSEIARSKDSLKLYDSSRGIYVDLRVNKAYFSTNGNTWSLLANGSWTPLRVVWNTPQSASGQYSSFQKGDGSSWIEETASTVYRYNEVSRSRESIHLFDASRSMNVLLLDNTAKWSTGANASTWNLLSVGGWVNGKYSSENF